jgi:formamidopyrimidine-DNA glycosylase
VPELPEVETFRRTIEGAALGRRIAGVRVGDRRILAGVTPRRLADRLRGRRFVEALRRGKHVLLRTDGDAHVGLHFGMSGRPIKLTKAEAPPPHTRVLFRFEDGGALAFRCPRMFGKVRLVAEGTDYFGERGLGPDALDSGPRTFASAMATRRGAAKGVLLNQSVLAGVGNVYADEVLFQTGIHPRAPADRLGREDHLRLHRALRRIFRKSLALGTDWSRVPRTWLIPHRERDGACPRCRTPLARMTVAGRTTFCCPSCQPE